MLYKFVGRLIGRLCDDCSEPLAGATVRLYRAVPDDAVIRRAVASTKETATVLTAEDIETRRGRLLIEAVAEADGTFRLELDSEKDGYQGEAFDLDVYCGTLTGHHGPPPPLQFAVTTVQPSWRRTEDGFAAVWEEELSVRLWCAIRGLLGWWMICGRVRVCGKGVPVPGVTVSAFDVDWLQDDPLGTATTDIAGHFRIDYHRADFLRTPFSPFLNVELTSGPDVYFRITGPQGEVMLDEPKSRGRQPDRENVGPCLCVKLCVMERGGGIGPYPMFERIGDYRLDTEIDSTAGGTGLTVVGEKAFFSTILLKGVGASVLGGQPYEYRFETRSLAFGAWKPVLPGQIEPTRIGVVQVGFNSKDVVVNGTDPVNTYVIAMDQEGWIKVPPDNVPANGVFVATGDLLRLDTRSLTLQHRDASSVKAGMDAAPIGLATDQFFGIRMSIRYVNAAQSTVAGECQRLAIANTEYDKVNKVGSWAPWQLDDQLAIASLDVAELSTGGCNAISDKLTVLYTAAHPNLGSVGVSMTGPGGPYHFALPSSVSPDYFGTTTTLLDGTNSVVKVSSLPSCAYLLTLEITLRLTTGEDEPTPIYDNVAFWKE
ncbi:MAG TPA: hypothetical protein VFC19_34010 [Candidatus Limnocylindrales bacterium]|nr:hypothetical protein [Candidatus Limnocylindrales bacterium]